MHHGTPLLSLLAIVEKMFKRTQTPQPTQSKKMKNIQHTIALVTKTKLAYILNQNNSLPEQTKYSKCTFTALLMTP